MLNRRVTRTILNTTETTAKTGTLNSDLLTLNLQTTDAFYIGFHGPFASRYIQVTTANDVASVLSASYWDGSAWVAVDDFQDQTASGGVTLAGSGFISWDNPGDWAKQAMTGIDSDLELYWIKLTVSVNLKNTTAIQSCTNLFSDDLLLRAYYPEIVTNSGYLPVDRTSFIEQHEAAKNLCIQRLKQRKALDDESQIIDINSIAVAAVHATAWLILNPIATADAQKDLAGRAFDQFNAEISSLSFDIDKDKDGVLDESERAESVSTIRVVRR